MLLNFQNMLNWGVVKITWGSVVVFCKKILEMGGGGNNVQWDGVGWDGVVLVDQLSFHT